MKTFAQIQNNKAHWVFEEEVKPDFHESIVLIDITDYDPMPKEGWDFDPETNEFTEPVYEEIPVEPEIPEVPTETVEQKIEALKQKIEEHQLMNLNVLMSLYEEIINLNTPTA